MNSISTDVFWQLIDQAAALAPADNDAKEQYLVNALASRSLAELTAFELALRHCLNEADDYGIMAAQKIIDGYFSDDSYLYFRCWLIGQGQAVYAAALQNPDTLAEVVDAAYECDFESLLYVTTYAYERQTGREEDDTFPRGAALSQGLDYDFLAPPTKGTKWTSDELPLLLPKLWAKFQEA